MGELDHGPDKSSSGKEAGNDPDVGGYCQGPIFIASHREGNHRALAIPEKESSVVGSRGPPKHT